MDVLLLRHGETEWSRDGKHTSTTDIPLTDVGVAQGAALRPLVAAHTFALVLVSPMVRARETAQLVGLGDDADVDRDLCEWDYGEYEGRTTAEIRAERPGWSVWTDGAPGGESPEEVARRADRVIERCRAVGAVDGGDVCLVAHAHLLRVLAARWVGLGAADGARLRLDTGTWSVLGYEREAPVVLRWNVPASPA
jgi:probable phosphoglycerate mutase